MDKEQAIDKIKKLQAEFGITEAELIQKNCANCKFWACRASCNVGFCIISKPSFNQGQAINQKRLFHSGCGLHTDKDFYCIVHQLKPKADEPSITPQSKVV